MAGTMEGLGVPLFGGYTSYQSDGTTSFLTVNSDGTRDFAWTDEGADNFISVTLTDSTTITSGYIQPYYANISVTGSYSTGSTQISAFATDISLSGTVSCEVEGSYVYVSETGTTTVSSLVLSGHVVYLEDMGGAPAMRVAYKAYSAGTNVAAQTDCGLHVESAGSGTWTSFIGGKGGTAPEYFLHYFGAGSDGRYFTDYTSSDSATKCIRIKINDSVYNIPCVADSCS